MLICELAVDGYSGVEVRVTSMGTEIIIKATHTRLQVRRKGGLRQLPSVVSKNFNSEVNTMELSAEKVNDRGFCAIAHSKSL